MLVGHLVHADYKPGYQVKEQNVCLHALQELTVAEYAQY